MEAEWTNYDAFVDSISDGFTIRVNELLSSEDELLCNADGFTVLCAAFTRKPTIKQLRATTNEQLEQIRAELRRGYELDVTLEQIVECLSGALRQSTGDESLDNFG